MNLHENGMVESPGTLEQQRERERERERGVLKEEGPRVRDRGEKLQVGTGGVTVGLVDLEFKVSPI